MHLTEMDKRDGWHKKKQWTTKMEFMMIENQFCDLVEPRLNHLQRTIQIQNREIECGKPINCN